MTKTPEGYHTITPYLVVRDGERAIEFYKKVFGAKERFRMEGPDNKSIGHVELTIGDSVFMLTEESPYMKCLSPESVGGSPVSLYVYVDDVDSVFNIAISEGATVLNPVTDMVYGDRTGYIRDPFGHLWSIATCIKDLSPAQAIEAGKATFKQLLGKNTEIHTMVK